MGNEYTTAQEYNHQGLVLFSQEKYEDALSYFRRAVEADAKWIEPYINMAQVYIMQDKYDDAEKELNRALLLDKKAAIVYFHLGNIALLKDDADTARTQYNKAISMGYDNVQIYINLAADADEKGDLETALQYYNRAITLDKFNPFPKARKVQLLVSLKRLPEALKASDSLIETNPDVFEGYHYKFSILTEMGKLEEAEQVLDRGIQLFPQDEAFFYDKARLLQIKGQPEEALKLIDEKISLNEENRSSMIAFKCELLLALERVDEAEPLLEEEYQRSYDSEIAFLRNSVAIARKDYDKVLECTEYILQNQEVDNYYYAAIYYHALALNKLGRKQEAEDAFQKALLFFRAACAKTPGQLQLYFYRAMCHEELKQYDKALELTDYMLKVDDNIAEVHLLRSKAFEALGNTTASEEEMSKVNAINPKLVEMLEE